MVIKKAINTGYDDSGILGCRDLLHSTAWSGVVNIRGLCKSSHRLLCVSVLLLNWICVIRERRIGGVEAFILIVKHTSAERLEL